MFAAVQGVDRRSRTCDQMVQAARSGVQNIAEDSQASGTSKKIELKLTNVARASLEELRLDYEDFLRQRGLLNLCCYLLERQLAAQAAARHIKTGTYCAYIPDPVHPVDWAL